MEAGDGFADGVGGALGIAAGAFAVLLLEFEDGFEFAEGFLFDGFGFGFVARELGEMFHLERSTWNSDSIQRSALRNLVSFGVPVAL